MLALQLLHNDEKSFLTKFSSFFQKAQHNICVSTANCPIQGAHPIVINMLYLSSTIYQ